jgi:membrane-associated phospholipid phosphatase
MIRPLAAAFACATLLAATPSAAEERSWYQTTNDDTLSLRLPADLIILGAGVVFTLGTELSKQSLAPVRCRFCNGAFITGLPGDPNNGPGTLNGVDQLFHDKLTGVLMGRKSADTISNVFVFGVLPVAAIAGGLSPLATSGQAGFRNVTLMAESVFTALTLVQVMKFAVARDRPFVRYGHGTDGATPDEGSTYDVNNKDSHISFPSGHTALATSLGVSLAMIATLEDSKAAPYLWGGAALGGMMAAALRMDAEKHYFTDVGTGFLFGAAAGVVMPLLHRKGGLLAESSQSLTLSTTSEGLPMAVYSGTF